MACSLGIFKGKSKRPSEGANNESDRVKTPDICASPGEANEPLPCRSATPSKSRFISLWGEDARKEEDIGLYEGSSRLIERTEALSKSRRRFSSILIRGLSGELAGGRGSKRRSVDVLSASHARPIKRRSFSFGAGPLQRFFGVEEQPMAMRSPSSRGSSPENIYSLLNLHPRTSPADWDFVCRGETPVVPARDASDELTLLEDFDSDWAGDISSSAVSPSGVSTPDPACRASSPPLSIRYRSPKGPKISSKDISDPIPIPSRSRRRAYIPPLAFDVLDCSCCDLQPRAQVD